MDEVKFECPTGASIDSEEQARAWVMELVDKLESERRQIDLIPLAPDRKRAFDQYRIKFGHALGVLVALQRCRKLSDVAYNGLRQRVMETAQPTVAAGVVRG
jgi:hypothetical protein